MPDTEYFVDLRKKISEYVSDGVEIIFSRKRVRKVTWLKKKYIFLCSVFYS